MTSYSRVYYRGRWYICGNNYILGPCDGRDAVGVLHSITVCHTSGNEVFFHFRLFTGALQYANQGQMRCVDTRSVGDVEIFNASRLNVLSPVVLCQTAGDQSLVVKY